MPSDYSSSTSTSRESTPTPTSCRRKCSCRFLANDWVLILCYSLCIITFVVMASDGRVNPHFENFPIKAYQIVTKVLFVISLAATLLTLYARNRFLHPKQ